MSATQTGKFALPYLAVAQAQKEITHNEALFAIDALLHCVVESVAATPPEPLGETDSGKCWLVDDGATGSFMDNEGKIACWTGGGWRFLQPCKGMELLVSSDNLRLEWRGDEWLQPELVENPSGGATIDAEARAALVQLLEYLRIRGVLRP